MRRTKLWLWRIKFNRTYRFTVLFFFVLVLLLSLITTKCWGQELFTGEAKLSHYASQQQALEAAVKDALKKVPVGVMYKMTLVSLCIYPELDVIEVLFVGEIIKKKREA